MIMNFLVMPIFFLSGALFPLTGLPSSIDIIASLNPLTYGVDGLRGALIGGQMQFGFGIDLAVLTGVTVLFLVIGSYLFSKIEI
jgi:ABC-2 type transport system permease protein